MKYAPPIGAAENAPYIDGNPAAGIEGSPVPAAAIEHPMREVVNLITAAGLTPDVGNLNQLEAAVRALFLPKISPGAAGNLLTSTGTAWQSAAPHATKMPINAISGVTATQVQQALEALNSKFASNAIPAGVVAHFAMSAAPAGWLKANGAAVSRTTYAALFAAIGTVFGAGDGSTTFNLPDLRGEFVRGWDDGRGVDASRTLGSGQSDAFQGHAVQTENKIHYGGRGGVVLVSLNSGNQKYGEEYSFPVTHPDNASYGAPRMASETRPRNVALLACIKY